MRSVWFDSDAAFIPLYFCCAFVVSTTAQKNVIGATVTQAAFGWVVRLTLRNMWTSMRYDDKLHSLSGAAPGLATLIKDFLYTINDAYNSRW